MGCVLRLQEKKAMEKIRILLIDDHAVVREGLKSLINADPGMEVVGEAADGNSGCEMAKELQPEIVVMDISMPLMNGVKATDCIRLECPKTRILVLTMHQDSAYMRSML